MSRAREGPRSCPVCKAENLPNARACVSCGLLFDLEGQIPAAVTLEESAGPGPGAPADRSGARIWIIGAIAIGLVLLGVLAIRIL
jgi:hypothetical protein